MFHLQHSFLVNWWTRRHVVIISLSAPLRALCLHCSFYHVCMALDKSLFEMNKYDIHVNVCSLIKHLCSHTRCTNAKGRSLSPFREFTHTQKNENTFPTPHCKFPPRLDLKREGEKKKRFIVCAGGGAFYKESVIIAFWAKQSLTLTTQNKSSPVFGRTAKRNNLCNTQFLPSSVNKGRLSTCSLVGKNKGRYNTVFFHSTTFCNEKKDYYY